MPVGLCLPLETGVGAGLLKYPFGAFDGMFC